MVTVGRNHHLELFIACDFVFDWFLLSWASAGDPERTESVTTTCYYCKQQHNTAVACIFSRALSFSRNTLAKEFTELLSQQSAASRQNMQDTAVLQNSQQGIQIPWKLGK